MAPPRIGDGLCLEQHTAHYAQRRAVPRIAHPRWLIARGTSRAGRIGPTRVSQHARSLPLSDTSVRARARARTRTHSHTRDYPWSGACQARNVSQMRRGARVLIPQPCGNGWFSARAGCYLRGAGAGQSWVTTHSHNGRGPTTKVVVGSRPKCVSRRPHVGGSSVAHDEFVGKIQRSGRPTVPSASPQVAFSSHRQLKRVPGCP